MQRASLLCFPVNVRHFVFLRLQGNIILQHVNHNCGWFVCTQIGYIHAHLLAGTQLFCPTIIWNIAASERLFKITQNKRTGGKKIKCRGKKIKRTIEAVNVMVLTLMIQTCLHGLPRWYDLLKRHMIQTNKSTPLPHNSLSLHLLSSSSCCHQQSSFYTHTSKSCSSFCKGNLDNESVHCVFVLIVVYIC